MDTEADKRLDEIGGHDELKGKLAIANAKLAYQTYTGDLRGRAVGGAGGQGRDQAALPVGVDLDQEPRLPRRDLRRGARRAGHGQHDAADDGRGRLETTARSRDTLEEDVEGARKLLDDLEAAGIDYDDVVETLEKEGVQKFADSFKELFCHIESKRDQLVAA